MRILVTLDGSPRAEYALGPAAQLARSTQEPATIVLLRVVDVPPSAVGSEAIYFNKAISLAVTASGDYLRSVAMRDTLHGVAVEQHVVTAGFGVAEATRAQAHTLRANLIFMVSHGRTGLAHVMLGSVAEEVALTAHMPVVIFRLDNATFDTAKVTPFTILAPLDGSPLAEAILPSAASLARALHGEVCLMQVVASRTGSAGADRALLATAEAYLTGIQQQISADGTRVSISVAMGDPVAKIEEKALNPFHPCDMIALATHGRTGMERFILGSVADEVMRRVPRPILMMRPEPATVVDKSTASVTLAP